MLGLGTIARKIFGTPNDRMVKTVRPLVAKINALEAEFSALTDAQIKAYVATGEPAGKAGAYAIQGGAEMFIARLSGSYSGVMGLPLYETACLLRAMDLEPGAEAGDPGAWA